MKVVYLFKRLFCKHRILVHSEIYKVRYKRVRHNRCGTRFNLYEKCYCEKCHKSFGYKKIASDLTENQVRMRWEIYNI